MEQSDFKGSTRQPVVAERQLVARGSANSLTIRVHQPELGTASTGQPWRCGSVLLGLPGIPSFYGPESELTADEVWFADGEDSLHALLIALADIRSMIDRVEEEFGVQYEWPPRLDWGHMVPQWITQIYGRKFEQHLTDVMLAEAERLINARTPNPYAWDDPRHPSQIMRHQWPGTKRPRDHDET